MVTCVSCQHEASLFLKTKDYDYRVSNNVFDYYRCQNCGLIFLHPVPDNLGDYYTNTYYEIPANPDELRQSAAKVSYAIELVSQFVSKGRVLDIGPAYGNFAFLAKQKGYEVNTIEMDPDCCVFLRNIVGVNVIQSDNPLTALQELGKYDVITLWHVIEHLAEPKVVVEAIANHLNPGGIAVFAAPNPDALQLKILRGRWRHMQAPRHLSLIPIPLFTKWGMAAGLKTVLVTCLDEGSLGLNWGGWYMSFMNFFTSPFPRWVMGVIGRIIHKLLIPIERIGWRGSAYTIVFQKPND